MRLIDADVLIPLIQEEKIEGKILDIIKALGDGLQAETLNQSCDRHIKIINSLPTIDAVPAKHGEWEYIGGYGYKYRWSECVMCAERKTNYCSYCGAKMDGGYRL